MRELKAVHAFDAYEAYTKTGDDDAAQVYLKSEADKVIAELKEKLVEQMTLCAWAELQLRHQKYERCLAKAKYWIAINYHCVDDKHRQIAEKRYYKWLKLAENFEEAK